MTFGDEVREVALVPTNGGLFEVRVDKDLICSRRDQGRSPELKELKQLLRDRVAPGMEIGHSDNNGE